MTSTLSALATLLKQTHIDDDEEVLRAADAALKQAKGDLEAQHVKLVALLKLDRYDEALKTLETGGGQLKQRASLEYAYALYKSGNPSAAADVAQTGSERGFQHVEAQARYRCEEFERAADIYRELESAPGEDAEADLRTNSGAVDAQLEWAGRGHLVHQKKPSREDLEAYETAYNAACGSIGRGELGQAEVLLKRAKDICSSLEDLSEQEKQSELLSISIQQIYVLTRLGRREDAEALARSIDAKAVPDASTRYIAQLNTTVASAEPVNPFLVQRLVAQDLHSLRPNQPFGFQSAILKENRYASNLDALKYSGTADSTQQILLSSQLPTTDTMINTISVVNAAAHAQNQTGKEALKHILPIIEQRPTDIGLALTIAQLYVSAGNSIAAVDVLESLARRIEQAENAADQYARYAPGLVATLVSLYESQGRKAQARSELLKAATYWRSKPEQRSPGIVHLLKAAGASLLMSGDADHQQLAREVFSELSKRDRSDRYAAAGLLAASPQDAPHDQHAALTPVDRLVSGIDADALERAGIAQPLAVSGAAVTARKRPADDAKPKKAKKIRPSRMPKNYDPSKTPDPERWLPLRDRSSYRPKGKKGKARQALLSQGAVANDSENSRPATPGGEVVKQKQQGGGANKKKKGKK